MISQSGQVTSGWPPIFFPGCEISATFLSFICAVHIPGQSVDFAIWQEAES